MSDQLNEAGRMCLLPVLNLTSEAQTSTGGAEITGIVIDSHAVTGRRFNHVKVEIPIQHNIRSTHQVVVTSNMQHATATGAAFVDHGVASTAIYSATDLQTPQSFAYERNMATSNRYWRVQFTPEFQTDASVIATATGTVFSYTGTLLQKKANRLPASG